MRGVYLCPFSSSALADRVTAMSEGRERGGRARLHFQVQFLHSLKYGEGGGVIHIKRADQGGEGVDCIFNAN